MTLAGCGTRGKSGTVSSTRWALQEGLRPLCPASQGPPKHVAQGGCSNLTFLGTALWAGNAMCLGLGGYLHPPGGSQYHMIGAGRGCLGPQGQVVLCVCARVCVYLWLGSIHPP